MKASSPRPSFLVALCLALTWGGDAGADYRLTDLGSFNTTGSLAINGMNASGDAVGTLATGGVDHAYKQYGGGAGAVPGLPAYASSSVGLAINANGDITGSFADHRNGDIAHAFRITGGVFQDLGTLATGSGIGTAIDAAGDIAGYGYLPGGIQRAFRMMNGGIASTINPLAGGTSNQATGINSSGTVVGTSDIGGRASRAFVATADGQVTDLLDLHTGSGFRGSTAATGINEQGTIIGYGDFGIGSHAFLAPLSGPLIDLGTTGSAVTSMATALNANNQVVGTLGFGGGVTHAFYWDATTRMVDLNSLLAPLDQRSWVLTQALAIGDSGQIAGLGYKDGQLHAFLLDSFIVTSAVPEPPAWALTALGGATLAGWLGLRRARSSARDAA